MVTNSINTFFFKQCIELSASYKKKFVSSCSVQAGCGPVCFLTGFVNLKDGDHVFMVLPQL